MTLLPPVYWSSIHGKFDHVKRSNSKQGFFLMEPRKVNITELARKANLSISTISRAVNAETRSKVAPRTLKKIDALLEKYSFTPNLAARTLRKSTTKTIGIVFPYLPGIFYSPYYQHILSGIADTLQGSEYQFKMLLLDQDPQKWDHYDFKIGERVDGLIIIHWFKYFSSISVLEQLGIPCVIINDIENTKRAKHARFVGIDNVLSGQIAAHYLYAAGHRKIAVMAGPLWSKDSDQRLEGFQEYLNKNGLGLDPRWIVRADYLEHFAYQKIDQLFKDINQITAIFCCNDQMAYGTIRRLRELGIFCPQDVSVLGFDDDPWSENFEPPLTTLRVPVYQLAKRAIQTLIDDLKIEDPFENRGIFDPEFLPVQLIERQSVKKI